MTGGGLFLQINKNGSKYWRLKYRFHNKEKLLSIGTYPQVSLKEARQAREKAKQLLANVTDPSFKKKQEKLKNKTHYVNTFQGCSGLIELDTSKKDNLISIGVQNERKTSL